MKAYCKAAVLSFLTLDSFTDKIFNTKATKKNQTSSILKFVCVCVCVKVYDYKTKANVSSPIFHKSMDAVASPVLPTTHLPSHSALGTAALSEGLPVIPTQLGDGSHR